MIGLALALYPWDWRQRYEAEYRELLAETGVTAAVLVDLVRGAVAAHRHHERLSGHRLPVGECVGAFAVGLVAWFIVVGGWSDIFKQSTFLLEWVLVQLAVGTFVALAAFL